MLPDNQTHIYTRNRGGHNHLFLCSISFVIMLSHELFGMLAIYARWDIISSFSVSSKSQYKLKIYASLLGKLLFPRFWSCRDSGIHKSGTGPYLPRVRRKCPPLMGLYPPRTALLSSNESAISQRDWGFSHRTEWCRSEKARFASPVDGSFRDRCGTTSGPGMGPYSIYSRGGAGSTYEPWPIRK